MHLKSSAKLEMLDLQGNRVADRGLAALQDLKELKRLNLFATDVSNAGLKHIGALRQLKELTPDKTQVTGDGLRHLRSMKELEWLTLAGNGCDRRSRGRCSSRHCQSGRIQWSHSVEGPSGPSHTEALTP